MFQLANFQINQNKALQKSVIKNQIDVKMFHSASDSPLSCHKGKTFSKL